MINFFQNYEIYIGDNSNYAANELCANGPFLDPNDSSSYVYDYSTDVGGHDAYGYGVGKVWPFGREDWCNLEGRYMHMVADMSN